MKIKYERKIVHNNKKIKDKKSQEKKLVQIIYKQVQNR